MDLKKKLNDVAPKGGVLKQLEDELGPDYSRFVSTSAKGTQGFKYTKDKK